MQEAQLSALRSRLFAWRDAATLPEERALNALLDDATTTLEAEDRHWRPVARDRKPGGLLDFATSDLPVIIVPDLHARADFLLALLQSTLGGRLGGMDVLHALDAGAAMVVCVGDGVHTENTTWGYERWLTAYDDWRRGNACGSAMAGEMHDSIATMACVMGLKMAFPAAFHFLKGNHENILNAEGGGDHAFRKFVLEGDMVRDFMQAVYGDVTLHLWSCFEHALPVCAVFGTFGISHAEPYRAFGRDEIINYHAHPEVILGLTWTANGEAQDGSARGLFHELNRRGDADHALWFGGHRPVSGAYFLRQGGQYVQIHNPARMSVAFVQDARHFDPQADILPVGAGGQG